MGSVEVVENRGVPQEFSAPVGAELKGHARTWPEYWAHIGTQLYEAWMCFDRAAGWFFGLDNSKYQWAVHEYNIKKREEEEAEMLRQERERELHVAAMATMEEAPGPAEALRDAHSPATVKA